MKESILALTDPERVSEALSAAGVSGCDAGAVELKRAWPNGRDGLSAVFAIGGRPWALHTASGAPPRRARAAIARGRALRLPGLGCWTHRFPDDPELPQLHEVFRTEPGSERRCRWLPRPWEDRTVRTVTYKPRRRCVVSLADGAVVLKLFQPERVAAVASRHAALQGNRRFGALRVAPPDAVCPDCAGLVWRATAGEPLLAKLRAPESEHLAAGVGSGLARMQRSAIGWTERYGARDEIETISRWAAAASAAFPAAAGALDRVVRRHARAVPPAAAESRVPAHRDFHDGQILAADAELVLLDLDTACHAPAELDPANFLAHLRLRELEGIAIDRSRIASAFLAGWAEVAGRDAIAPDRLRWWEAGALLRLACVYAFRPRWAHLSDRLLVEASKRLETQ